MLKGWYCRTLANEQAANIKTNLHGNSNDKPLNIASMSDDSMNDNDGVVSGFVPHTGNGQVDFKSQYKYLKQKLKFLLYENEFFQDALRSSQRRLLKVSRDRSFLLDRLLQYEKPDQTSSESDETDTSCDETNKPETKKRKIDMNAGDNIPKPQQRKRKTVQSNKPRTNTAHVVGTVQSNTMNQDGHMTPEEVERHLKSRLPITELITPPTVPQEMFSNEPSLDSESNDQMVETSPSNIGEECLSADHIIKSEYNP